MRSKYVEDKEALLWITMLRNSYIVKPLYYVDETNYGFELNGCSYMRKGKLVKVEACTN